MLNEMSDAQRLVLQSAAAREDRLLQPRAGGAAAKASAGKLMGAGWAREVKAPKGGPVWRKDAASGESFALKLTPKGLKAVAESAEKAGGETGENRTPEANSRWQAPSAAVSGVESNKEPIVDAAAPGARAPRGGSKLDRVLLMLSADTGATMADLMSATGWLEHSTRAALTGLRRRGYDLRLTRGERGGVSVYRVTPRNGEATK